MERLAELLDMDVEQVKEALDSLYYEDVDEVLVQLGGRDGERQKRPK